MRVYLENNTPIDLDDEPFSSGGEGEVRKVVSSPPEYRDTCVKIYFKKVRTATQENKIRYMVNNPPARTKGDGYMMGWPLAVIVDEKRNFIGFLMHLAFRGSEQLVNLTSIKVSRKLGPEWHQCFDRSNGVFALISRLKLIHNIAIPIYLLHSTGKYVLKDFKPQNVLVTQTGSVTIVDMDSIQITNGNTLMFPGGPTTTEYMPPEFYTRNVGKNPSVPLSKSWDNFAVGVVFYQILFGLHPYVVTPKNESDDSSSEIYQNIAANLFPFGANSYAIERFPEPHNRFNRLPASIQMLFKRAFSSNPDDRPNAEEWGKKIHEELKNSPKVEKPPLPAPLPKPQPQPKPQPKPQPGGHDHDHDDEYLICPECGRPSNSIKSYVLPHLWIFVWVYIFWQNIQFTCCPHCMRKHILIKSLYHIALANILWPFIILPWSIVQFIRSFSKGHSKRVRDMID